MKYEVLPKVSSVILLHGETGTGKTTIAKRIHNDSVRANKPFVTIDLAAISETLIESEIFGHKKGSFTGAISDKQGFLSKVNGGTLFLDEIGEISLAVQKKLLRVIEERKYYPVGSTIAETFEGTIIVATHNELAISVKEGSFREDLFYRLNIFSYKLPALKDYSSELRAIILKEFNDLKVRFGVYHLILSECAIDALLAYQWKGNFRELKNVLEYVIMTCEGLIRREDLPISVLNDCNKVVGSKFHESVMQFEKKFLVNSLTEYAGKINLTSREIGLCKATLISKIKKYDINVAELKLKNHKGTVVGL